MHLPVYFSSCKLGMSNLLLLVGIADTHTQVNILKQVKNVCSSFGHCGLLKTNFCLNRNFCYFTHHLFIQWGILKREIFQIMWWLVLVNVVAGEGTRRVKGRGREGRQKGGRGWGTRSERGRGHLAIKATDIRLRKLLLLPPLKVFVSLLEWKLLLGSFFKLQSLFSQEISKIFPLGNYLRM